MDATISQFLSHVPYLQIFRYSHEAKLHGCQYEWSAGEFVAAVGKCCGETLTHVAISIEGSMGSIVTGVTSLQEFKKLEHLKLDMGVFIGPSIESGERVPHLARPEKIKWNIEHIPPLTSMLRRTTRTLTLNGLRGDKRRPTVCEQLLKDFNINREIALPSLHNVVVEQVGEINAEGREPSLEVAGLCERVGVNASQVSSGHAPWRRCFGTRFPVVDKDCNDCMTMRRLQWRPPTAQQLAEREVTMSKYYASRP